MPSDLAEQVSIVHAACEAMGVPNLTVENFEADDVLGTLAVKACAAGFDVAIVTGDEDFYQLVCEGLRIFNPKDEGTWFDSQKASSPSSASGRIGWWTSWRSWATASTTSRACPVSAKKAHAN